MSVFQDVCFSSGSNTRKECVLMSNTRHVFVRIVVPPPSIFFKKSRSSRFRGSDGCTGQESVWITNRAALFARSIQGFSSTIMVMMPLNNPYIVAYEAVMFTAKGSSIVIWLVDCCFSSCGSKNQWVDFRSSLYQYSSWSRSFPRYIATSLTLIYYSGAGVMPKGNHSQRKAISYIISMHVNTVVAFVCI